MYVNVFMRFSLQVLIEVRTNFFFNLNPFVAVFITIKIFWRKLKKKQVGERLNPIRDEIFLVCYS